MFSSNILALPNSMRFINVLILRFDSVHLNSKELAIAVFFSATTCQTVEHGANCQMRWHKPILLIIKKFITKSLFQMGSSHLVIY